MTETTERELLPCPFCGGEATFDSDDAGWHWVECKKCGAMTDSDHHGDYDCTLALASLWNRRAAQPVTQPHQSEVAAQPDHSEQALDMVAAQDAAVPVERWRARAIAAETKLAMLKPISAHWQARAQTAEAKLAAQAWNDAPETDAARLNFALEALVAAGHVSALRVRQALALYPGAAATGAAQPATQGEKNANQ